MKYCFDTYTLLLLYYKGFSKYLRGNFMLILGILLCIIALILEIYFSKTKSNTKSDASKDINYNERYEKKEYLLTQTELKFYRLLKQITDELNLVICPQVTLYQIVNNKNYKYLSKIQKKIIDIVITV